MFFTIGQKIINLMLKTNWIFNYKIGIVGFFFYLIVFIFIKSPLLVQINWNNWMLFVMFVIFLLIDGWLLGYEYSNKIKKLENQSKPVVLAEPIGPVSPINTVTNQEIKPNNSDDYETTTELITTEQ